MISNVENKVDNEISTYPIPKCFICGSTGNTVYSDLYDRLYGAPGKWNLSKCSNPACDLYWLDPIPDEKDISKAYKEYYTHTNINSAILPFLRPLEKGYLYLKYGYNANSASALDKLLGVFLFLLPTEKAEVDFSVLYLKENKNGKLLDVGCGNGWLMKRMREFGWNVAGIDPDPKAVEYCRSINLDVNPGSIYSQNYQQNTFDVITVNHVIEHIYDPSDLIKECYRILKPGGRLIIITPNTKSWIHKIYGRNWYPLEPPRHLFMYNPDNIKPLFNSIPFTSLDIATTIRNEFWVYILSRSIKRTGYFKMGAGKQPKIQHLIGRLVQQLSWLINKFDKKSGGELKVIATK